MGQKRLIYVRGVTFLRFQSPVPLNPVLNKKVWASVHSVRSLLQLGLAQHQVN